MKKIVIFIYYFSIQYKNSIMFLLKYKLLNIKILIDNQ